MTVRRAGRALACCASALFLLISLLLLLDHIRAAAGDAPISVAVLREASGA